VEKLESIYVRRDRLAGGLQGLLIGDALGVPYEFHDPLNLPPSHQIDFDPPANFQRSHRGVPPGTWSDDGAQALCLLQSLLARDTLDLSDFSRRLMDWADHGHMAVDGKVFDIGVQTARAIARLRAGVAPEEAGPSSESDNGNGSLMRVLPLALWHVGDDSSLMTMAAQQSLPTHGHPRAAVACALLCLWARAELESSHQSWERAAAILRQLAPAVGFPPAEIEHVLDAAHADGVAGSGYVVDTLWSARQALDRTSSYAVATKPRSGLSSMRHTKKVSLMEINVFQFEDLTNDRVGAKLDAREDFVIEGIKRVNMAEAVGTVEKLIEDRGMRCRIYQKGRVAAALGATAAAVVVPVVGEVAIGAALVATTVGSAAHHLATFNPDYEVAKNLVTGSLTITYQKKR